MPFLLVPLVFAADKATVNAYDRVPSEVRVSDNAALWWPEEAWPVDEALSGRVLDAVEDAWRVYFDDLELPEIASTDVQKFNLYVGGTQANWPATREGALGYHAGDPTGADMIVLNLAQLRALDDAEPDKGFLERTLHHEVFHAVHGLTPFYAGSDSWLKEAGADWAANKVDPTNPWRWYSAAMAALRPNLAVHTNLGVPDGASANVDLWHEYGMSRLLERLEDDVGTASMVSLWHRVRTLRRRDPSWPVLTQEVEAAGGDIEDALLSLGVRNATLAHPDDVGLQAMIESLTGTIGDDALLTPVAAVVEGDGAPDGLRPEVASLPGAIAYNHVVWKQPTGPWAEVIFEPDLRSDRGRDAAWAGRAVIEGGPDAGEVSLGLSGAPERFAARDARAITLVLGVLTPPADDNEPETFGYRIRLRATAQPVDPNGCGCAGFPSPSVLWPLAALAPLVARRRARRSRP